MSRMSSALSGSSALQCVKLGDTLEIHDGIIFDFYLGLPHTCMHFKKTIWNPHKMSTITYWHLFSVERRDELFIAGVYWTLCTRTIIFCAHNFTWWIVQSAYILIFLFYLSMNHFLPVRLDIVVGSALTSWGVECHQEASVQLKTSCWAGRATLWHLALHYWRREYLCGSLG